MLLAPRRAPQERKEVTYNGEHEVPLTYKDINMSISTPVVNGNLMYVNGMRLAYASATTFTVSQGLCRNSTNVNDINIGLPLNVAATQTGELPVDAGAGAVTVDITTTGAGGLDNGTIAASTFYAVHAVGDSFGVNPGSAIISTSVTAPVLPAGYDMFRRIGFIKTDGSTHVLAFRQEGLSCDRWMWWDAAIATGVTSGSSATFATVDCSAGIPAMGVNSEALFLVFFTPTGAGNTLELRPGLSSATNGYARLSGAVAAVAETGMMLCPIDTPYTDAVDYLVTGSAVAIDVAAYLDQLEPQLS
jgi:hypothetical protein